MRSTWNSDPVPGALHAFPIRTALAYTGVMTDAADGPVATEMRRRLEQALSPTQLTLQNDSDQHAGHAGHDGSGESHFSLTIESTAFKGLNRVQRQRLVFRALGDLMAGKVHALQIQATAPGDR
jgi:BolA protein